MNFLKIYFLGKCSWFKINKWLVGLRETNFKHMFYRNNFFCGLVPNTYI